MKHKPLKLLPAVVLALSASLAGCGRHDADLTKAIPGHWRQEMKSSTNLLTIAPDGTFEYSRFTGNRQTTFTNTGTWKIKWGEIVLTATNKIGDHPLPFGVLFKAKVVGLNDQQ